MFGTPIIEHVMERAIAGGVTEFVIITGYRSEVLSRQLRDISGRLGIPLTTVYNAEWQRGNGISVLKGKSHLTNPFVLLMSDHIFDPTTLSDLIDAGIEEREVILAVDRKISDNPHVDLDDVTSVLDENGHIQNIGKHMERYTCFDTGMFLCTPHLFTALEQSLRETGNESLSGGMGILSAAGLARTFDIGDRFWIDIDNDDMYDRAERYLRETGSGE